MAPLDADTPQDTGRLKERVAMVGTPVEIHDAADAEGATGRYLLPCNLLSALPLNGFFQF